MTRYFQEDPEIIWTKVLCPYCKKPTGHDTECENLGEENFIKVNALISLPIFSEDCFFKNEKLWKADINYAFSPLLLQTIIDTNIKGLDKIIPVKSQSFQISVARLNEDKKIKEQISHIYRKFIKEMQSKELEVVQVKSSPDDIIGIKFPNGESYTFDPSQLTPEEIVSQEASILDVVKHYPGSELIINLKGD